ncbi:MAG: sensor histidine kinase [Herbaspirillum huttiense]|uniref:sensor histidine kinase n=1 Tax=Herbaspirillum huttiense TaxID=863372 RepID=UPI001AC4C467|nr:sensor histidine kinase [Herbaspirillum huttiense]MBN9355463.1 sensor histidine kinase [Herbaspirillum huttiense]
MSDPAAPALSAAFRLREEERTRIARDMHDELGAQLTGIGMALGQLREQLALERHAALPQADYAAQLLAQAREGMERIIDDLHPPIVEFGLADALRWQCRHFSRQSGVDCQFLATDQLAVQDDFLVLSLLRILREALNNIARHAAASQVEVRVEQTGDSLHLHIDDNGRGFDPAATGRDGRRGHGLANMRQRAAALGGSAAWEARAGHGSRVHICIPVAH